MVKYVLGIYTYVETDQPRPAAADLLLAEDGKSRDARPSVGPLVSSLVAEPVKGRLRTALG